MASDYVQNKLDSARLHAAASASTHTRYFDQLSAYQPVPRGSRVLDLACGAGEWISFVASRGTRACAVDLQFDFVKALRDRARSNGHEIGAVQCDATTLPFREDTFDVVTAFSLLEHVPDWKALVSEGLRVLKPGGVFWFTTTNRLCPVTDEIQGFPLYPWYPAPVKSRVMNWVRVNRPDLVAYSSAPAVHWFTHDELVAHLATRGCFQTASFLDYVIPRRRNWRSRVLEATRASGPLRRLFNVVHPCVGLMTRKSLMRYGSRGSHRAQARPARVAEFAEGFGAALEDVMACPRCRRHVRGEGAEVRCPGCRLAYPIRDEIPVMSAAEATIRKNAVSG